VAQSPAIQDQRIERHQIDAAYQGVEGKSGGVCETNSKPPAMKYDMVTPCDACPFLKKHAKAYGMRRLREFASGAFHCHKTGYLDESDEEAGGEYLPTADSQHCAGALIFNEKRDDPNQMMRIAERLGIYDRTKLNMKAKVV
jgi:hypothetical protein